MKAQSLCVIPGSVRKMDKLATFESPLLIPELVLETVEPFPGYYERFSHFTELYKNKKESFYLVLKHPGQNGFEERFLRATWQIRASSGLDFSAARGTIHLQGKEYQCLRLRVSRLFDVKTLLDAYKEAGFEFIRSRNIHAYLSPVEVKKFFDLAPMGDGLYKELNQACTYYILIPHPITLEQLKAYADTVRINYNCQMMDAALASIYTRRGVMDLIRIYYPIEDTKLFGQMQHQFLSLIQSNVSA